MTAIGLFFIALDILVVYARLKKNRIEEENKIDQKDRITMFWFLIEVVGVCPCCGRNESKNTKNYKEGANRNIVPR